MTAGTFQSVGLSIAVHEPLAVGGNYLFMLDREVNSYQHEILSLGGYWTASIGLTLRLPDAEQWFEQGIGRQIKVYNQNGKISWEGVVNSVTINAGAVSETIGPLFDIANRASVKYAPIDTSTYPITVGSETTTTISDNEESQANYGIIEKIVGAGQCTDTMAETVRDVVLTDNAWPGRTGQISISPGNSQQVQITLDCVGNAWWLKAYIYNNTGTTIYTLLEKLQDVIDFDPNGYLSTNWANLEDNAFAVPEMEADDRFAWDVIAEMVGLGDGVDARTIYGVYDDLVSFYSSIPTAIEYQHFLADPAQRVLDATHNLVYPWDVRPGKWLIVPDFLTGTIPPPAVTDLRKDKRVKFLESVRYSAPWSLNLSGGKTDKLSLLLAQLSYTGGLL